MAKFRGQIREDYDVSDKMSYMKFAFIIMKIQNFEGANIDQ